MQDMSFDMQRLPFTLARLVKCNASSDSCDFSFNASEYPPPPEEESVLNWLNACEAIISENPNPQLTAHSSQLTAHTSHVTRHASHLITPQPAYDPIARRIPRNAIDIYALGSSAYAPPPPSLYSSPLHQRLKQM